MALTDTAIKNAKPDPARPAGFKLTDGEGLYLLVKAAGKYWRMDYRFADKRKTLALGVYPAVPLKMAREKREEARALLAQGIDPAAQKRIDKATTKTAAANTFEATAREFHATQKEGWSEKYARKWLTLMERNLFHQIGRLPLDSITAPMLLDALRRVESRGVHDTAHVLRIQSGQVFRYGIQTGRCERDPVPDLRGALKPYTVKHMAAILEPRQVGELLRAIEGYEGSPLTRAALKLSALLFQRPANIRAMEWCWIDFEKALLTIPAAAMKRRLHGKINGRPHLVPLAPQAVAALQEVLPLSGHRRYVFPSVRTGDRPMSDNTINAALRRLGFANEEMSAHGFRAMARTLIAERFPDIHEDVIEAQLAHGKSGPLGMAYGRAEYMAQRVKMMQTWADYLDQLRDGAKVFELRKAG